MTFKQTLTALCVSLALATPLAARADMPQTDVALLAQMDGQSVPKQLLALEHYYALHVSELDVQMKIEVRTGAFFALKRAKDSGDAATSSQAQKAFDDAAAAVKVASAHNRQLRQRLFDDTDIDFADSLVMAPDAPNTFAPAGDASADLVGAWENVQAARAVWSEARLNLLDVQDRYNNGEKVSVGDAMRAITKAEVSLARAAGAFRLARASIAASRGTPIGDVLNGL